MVRGDIKVDKYGSRVVSKLGIMALPVISRLGRMVHA